ncbi:CGNR zinc finger domain-containing protein [Kribbella sp. NPDC023972]|uniref:CGNR zinc finger domain-containing protein n=1 Tax=Kribbella sp. NPDC023972 TaxID=3154795 RepID=UPI0033C3CC4D
MKVGDEDGHGLYGLLEETADGLVCHECGRALPNLGLHAWRGHGMTAAQYREKHGLQRRRGLVASTLRARIQANAAARMATPAGQAFAAARDPQRAQDARLNQVSTWRAATYASTRAAFAGRGRLGIEVTCQNPECGAVFCPLTSARRRRFCSRTCASSRAVRAGLGRLGTEVTCRNPECGAVFCPLDSAYRRRFCSRRCASIYSRSLRRAAAGDSSGPDATPR